MRCINLILLIILLNSCNERGHVNNVPPKNFIGYWIPKNINWNTYDEGSNPDIAKHKEASCYIICIQATNKLKLISSTLSLGEKDSLGIQTDIYCSHSKWHISKSGKIDVSNLKSKSDKISITNSADSVLSISFNGIEYIKTDMIDNWSLNEINNCPDESNP